jgi:hypothetical protein
MSQSSSYVEFSLLVMFGFVMYERESRSRSECMAHLCFEC